jgi:hypothetical protein
MYKTENNSLNFERSLSLSTGCQSSLVSPCNMSLGGPAVETALNVCRLFQLYCVRSFEYMNGYGLEPNVATPMFEHLEGKVI